MKRATFKILFYPRKNNSNPKLCYPIYGRITINKEKSEFRVSLETSLKEWNYNVGMYKEKSPNAIQGNKYLLSIRASILRSKQEIEASGVIPNARELRNAYLGIEENTKTVLGIFEEHNEWFKTLVGIDYAPGTMQRYKTSYKHTKDFIKYKYNKNDLPLSAINPQFIKNYEQYLKTVRKCGHNSTIKYLKNFKKIIRIALSNGWMTKDPFVGLKFHLKPVDMDFLNENELNRIMNKPIKNKRIGVVRDIYIFCCFTGLAFIDIKTLKYMHISEGDNGSYWIRKKRQKTKNWSHIPILQPAQDLINKYKDHPYVVETGFVFPVMSNQKMNAYLKEIADVCNIDKNLSTHTARHTFATTVTLANQVSIEVVSKMLGHSSINMTKKYARVVDDLIYRDTLKIVRKYGTKSLTE